MSLSHETLAELMSLADGELKGDARQRAEQLLAENDEARRAFETFRAPHVRLWLAESLDRRATAGAADAIADAVMARLAGGPAGARGVVRAEGAGRRRPPRTAVLVASLVGVTALAAGIALFMRLGARPSGEQAPLASVGLPSVDVRRPPAEPPSGQGVEVDEVDSPRGISVFEIPLGGAAARVGARSGSSVVVWIDDEAPK